jgi:hypothetical protein
MILTTHKNKPAPILETTVAMPDMEVDNEGHTARQIFIVDVLKSSILVEGSDEDLLMEMVKQGLVILHYDFGEVTPILHTMIVENKVFTERL